MEFNFEAPATFLNFDEKGKLQLDDVVKELHRLHPEWAEDGEEIRMRKYAQKDYWENQWRKKHYPEDFDPMMK